MGDPSIENLARVWRSVSELCAGLADSDWDKPTGCPGWTVQDQLAHLIAPESIFLGRPQPATVEMAPPYVKNDLGRINEAAILYRRGWAASVVLTEFDEVMGLRLEQLEEMSDEELDEESWTPTGPGTYRDLLAIRVLDCWVHEQDIREAIGRPGHLEGPAPAHVLGRMFMAMPFVVGKKAEADEGSVVRFEISGPTSGEVVVGVSAGRGRAIGPDDAGSGDATAIVRGNFRSYTRVCAGREDPALAIESGGLGGSGDEELVEAVIRALPFMI